MHTVLASPDIINNVFANLAPADLSRALRVCRLWNEWSDVLWSSLPTLSPLLRLTFPFVFTGEDEKYIQSVPLYQLDRTRLAQLSHSIRHLDASGASSGTFFHGFNPNIPGFLLDLCEPGSSLLPRLQTLTTQCKTDSELLGVLPLLCPSLRSLEVSVHHAAIDYMQELLGGIEANAYGLERLDISCQPRLNKPASDVLDAESPIQRELDSYIYIPPIASALTALGSTLRVLSVPASSMSIDTLLALSQLPHLQSLAFTGSWCSEAHGDEWSEIDSTYFASLERLSLPCSVEPATRLLSILPETTPLQTLEITSPDTPIDESISELCTSLSRFQTSLQDLSIALPTPILAPINESRTKWSAFNPLLSCGRLESLALGLAIELSEVDCSGIVRAFPRLRVLSLLAKVSFPGRAQLAKLQHLIEFRAGTSAFVGDSLLVDAHSPLAMLNQEAPTLMVDMTLNL